MIDEVYRQKIELLNHCSFQVASWPKRFVRDMKGHLDEPDYELTVKQRRVIDNLYWHYRKQVWHWIEALRMSDAPPVIEPNEAWYQSEDESTRILGEQLERWASVDDKASRGEVMILHEKPSQTRKQREALEKLEKWNKVVKGVQ